MRSYKMVTLSTIFLAFWVGAVWASPYDDALFAKNRGDYVKARGLLHSLAVQGDANSQFQLSLLLRNGQGGSVDAKEAIRWLRQAAKQNNASAQSNLGSAYSRGWGVPQDPVRAVVWFTIAAASGSTEAQTNRTVALRRMTQQDINRADDMTKACLQSDLSGCD
jgi:TPR repeat protein